MGSHGDGGGSGGAHTHTQDSQSSALVRQGSLYSLTLDEVQHQLGHLGKPLSSMNLDELLKTVWTAEASQGEGGTDFGVAQPGDSSLPLSGDLSKKTVDEVWQDIQQGQKRSDLDRKATLGEMTLEDFLVKAGIVAESSPGNKNLADSMVLLEQNAVQQPTQWTHYQIPTIHQSQQPPPPQQQLPNMLPVYVTGQPLPVVPNPIMDTSFPETQVAMSPTMMATLSDTQAPGTKRTAPDTVVEKSAERRQKRMIKNRESAARSRARKQAYTHELENKVSRLEEENERLKKQKEKENALPYVPPPEPKYQLRRTSSAPF
nr:ABSCISIC ACID-INSENSITIVE 5-like protein 2 [Ipomoea trifida]